MLKRLELVGFKSFADKTAFDFGTGITAVVGPNGSGKSNIVDAVRWILGEQSAKSLRGGEMADVIFNGSTSRRSLGLAEVTMTFDNSRRVLATDADEVQITRRVYRSGEGEYLINQQISRLRDIKELFLGSGAGADAYCIIEQGKVDVLLQSSTKERRTIFEEAAGISRFKAKKLETLRKLERVDQNLQRLRDIVEEVEKQLRSVKLQAAKAQRYQEYSGRLKELRVALGLDEFHQLTELLDAESAVLEKLRTELHAQALQVESWEADTRRLEEAILQLDAAAHEQEALLADARQQIAGEESTLTHERSLSAELETDLAATRGRMTELNARVSALAAAAEQAAGDLRGVEGQGQEQRQGVNALEHELHAVSARLSDLHKQVQAGTAEHLEQMRQSARLHNDAVSFKSQRDNLDRERQRLQSRGTQAAEHLAALETDLQELTQADEALQIRLGTARHALAAQRQEREQLQQLHDETNKNAADLRAQRSGLASRIEVLEGLERSHEGLGTGVREMLALRAQPDPGPWRTVLGMIADCLTVRREYAPLIDLALGDRAQRFLVRDRALLAEALQAQSQPFSGRVGFVPLGTVKQPASGAASLVVPPFGACAQEPPEGTTVVVPLVVPPFGACAQEPPEGGTTNDTGIIALAEALVSCEDPELEGLPAQLLGYTLVVRDLAAARELAPLFPDYRFVTMQGELLEPDGTLTIGVHHAEAGILSRKSELRELRQQVVELDGRSAEVERQLAEVRDRGTALTARTATVQEEIDTLAEQASELRTRIGQHRQRREGLHEEVVLSRREITEVEREIETREESWQKAKAQAEAADLQVQALHERLEKERREIQEREQDRQQRQQDLTVAKVALAQVEERLTALRARHRQIEDDLVLRRLEQEQGGQRLAGARQRLEESQYTMLQASAALARWYLDKEKAERSVAQLAHERDRQRQERQLLAERAQNIRNEWRSRQEEAHARELEVNDLRHRRDTLVDRLREDYQIELAEIYRQALDAGKPVVLRAEAEAAAPPSPPGIGEEPEAPSPGVGISTVAPPDIEGEPEAPSPLTERAGVVFSSLDVSAVNEEIAELRRKLSRLGSVNLDSLQELADLETRARTLQVQSDDLSAAKRSLDEIIQTINQDSRRLFTESFAAIRTHFQELFRKLFGGGMADILLEDETDILESGIEIIARPPGKELRSISLMSGGEKTLTAVALLLAIFRSKPSPFCILDEVDAALDEANIGRYTAVLHDFLDRSQFIIVTHSKKTMACADVLYGITMQESGVSRRVSVRFEDWPEDGQPPAPAVTDGARESFAGR